MSDELLQSPALAFDFGGGSYARRERLDNAHSYMPATTQNRVQSIRYGNQITVPQDGKWYEVLKPEWGESGTRTIHVIPNLSTNFGSNTIVSPGYCKIVATSGAVAVDDASALIFDIGRGIAVNVTASEAHVYVMFPMVYDTVGIPPYPPFIVNAWASDVMTNIANLDTLTLTDFQSIGPNSSIYIVQPSWSRKLELTGRSYAGSTEKYNTTVLVQGGDVVGEIVERTLGIGVVIAANPYTQPLIVNMPHFYGILELTNTSMTDTTVVQLIWHLQH